MKIFKWVHPTQKYPTYSEMNAIRRYLIKYVYKKKN